MFSGPQTLGETPVPKPETGGLLTDLFGIVAKGYNIFADRESAKRSHDIKVKEVEARIAQAKALPMSTVPQMAYMPAGTDWTLPIVLGVGALGVGAIFFMKK